MLIDVGWRGVAGLYPFCIGATSTRRHVWVNAGLGPPFAYLVGVSLIAPCVATSCSRQQLNLLPSDSEKSLPNGGGTDTSLAAVTTLTDTRQCSAPVIVWWVKLEMVTRMPSKVRIPEPPQKKWSRTCSP